MGSGTQIILAEILGVILGLVVIVIVGFLKELV